MRALLSKDPGGPETLTLEEVADPAPGPGEVVLDVKACGLNFFDLLIIRDLYQERPPRPFAPGGEVAGVVSSVGEGVEDVRAGERCVGLVGWGGLAEKVVVPATRLAPIPEAMDFATAAGFVTTYGTSLYALKQRANLEAGQSVFVMGAAGGVGLAAVEIAKAMGARVFAGASSQDKLEAAKSAGAQDGLVYGKTLDGKDAAKAFSHAIKTMTGGGADVIYDPVGGPFTEPAVRALAPGGRLLVVGFAAGEIPKIPINLLLVKDTSLVGVYWGAWTARDPKGHLENMGLLLEWWRAGKVRPRIHAVHPFDKAAEAMADLAERRAKGKVVVAVDL